MPDAVLIAADVTDEAAIEADARLVSRVGRRLVLWAAGTTLVVLVGLGIVLYAAVAQSLTATGIHQLDTRADVLRHVLEGPGGRPPDGDNLPIGVNFGGGTSGTFALVLDHAGRVLVPRQLPTSSGLPDRDSLHAAISAGRDVRLGTVDETPVRILTTTAESLVGTVYVQIVQDRTAEDRTLSVLVLVLVVGGFGVVLVAAAVGGLYSQRALVPIRESLTAQRRALRRQREFAADASHELRTPLTVIRSNVDYLRRHEDRPNDEVRGALDDIAAEADHLTGLVEELLLLARSDSGTVEIEHEQVDLGDVAAQAASSLAATGASRRVSIVTDPEPGVVLGDAARLRQLVVILVDNAVAHSPEGGSVEVVVRQAGTRVRLTVEDDGPGLPEEDLPRLFERFWRAADAPAGGAGLGLAIAHWIVTAHGGTITAGSRESGGARFTVELPGAA